MLKNRKIILASGSPRRKKILKSLGLKFTSVKTNLNEDLLIKKFKNCSFSNLVKILALSKAISVGTRRGMFLCENKTILGFDTIVACKNKIIGKPKNKKDALKKLLFLSNKEHKVFTGIAIVDLEKRKIILDYEVTKVKMKRIKKKDAINYIKTNEPMDKAGAYAIQGRGKQFIDRISGDYSTVVGLPIKKFKLLF